MRSLSTLSLSLSLSLCVMFRIKQYDKAVAWRLSSTPLNVQGGTLSIFEKNLFTFIGIINTNTEERPWAETGAFPWRARGCTWTRDCKWAGTFLTVRRQRPNSDRPLKMDRVDFSVLTWDVTSSTSSPATFLFFSSTFCNSHSTKNIFLKCFIDEHRTSYCKNQSVPDSKVKSSFIGEIIRKNIFRWMAVAEILGKKCHGGVPHPVMCP